MDDFLHFIRLELWVNFDHKYCFLAFFGFNLILEVKLAQFPSGSYYFMDSHTLSDVSPISVRQLPSICC